MENIYPKKLQFAAYGQLVLVLIASPIPKPEVAFREGSNTPLPHQPLVQWAIN